MCQVFSFSHCHGRHIFRYPQPLLRYFPAQALCPFRSNFQRQAPVLHLKGRIPGHHWIMAFLDRNQRSQQFIYFSFFIIYGKIRHEFRRLFHQLIILFQKCCLLSAAIRHFQHINNMRLLPHQQHGNRRRTVHRILRNHLRPPCPFVSISRSIQSCLRQMLLIPDQTPLQQLRMVPQRQIRLMPQVHLQMKLSVPTVTGQTGLLRRYPSGRLNRQQIL